MNAGKDGGRGQAPRILVVDDERSLRGLLSKILRREGYAVVEADCGEAALQQLAQRAVHLVITDLRLPGVDGLEVLRHVRRSSPETQVVVLTAFGTVASAVEAMKLGAADYLTKPLQSPDELRLVVREALARRRLEDEAQALRPAQPHQPVARDPAMLRVLELARAVAPGEATVLITGESGTGKEIVARTIHGLSPRAARPLVAVNCAALSETLLDSELFGHERGAFTGAGERRRGRFELADGSTLFLDEVGEMSPALQAKLLRVLQERELTRVGGSTLIRVDVRVIAATNRDLQQAIRQGRFREDLYYRLDVFPITLPPLRERPADILPLAEHFLALSARRAGKPIAGFSADARQALLAYPWPGNVRELMNVVERAAILEGGSEIRTPNLLLAPTVPAAAQAQAHGQAAAQAQAHGQAAAQAQAHGQAAAAPAAPAAHPGAAAPPTAAPLNLQQLERQAIEQALARTGGNRRAAAALLGIGLRTLQYRLKEYGAAGSEQGDEEDR